MRLYLNAGFGEPLGVDTLRMLKSKGFVGVRQDVRRGEDAEGLLKEIAESDTDPILLVGGGKMEAGPEAVAALARHVAIIAGQVGLTSRDLPLAIEIGNEPDISPGYRDRPERFAEAVRLSTERIRAASPRIEVISGGIAMTNDRGLGYLARAADAGLPADCSIGYHTYRTTQRPEDPVDGFTSREAEYAELKRIAAGRPIWCTETGWHTAPSPKKVWGLWKRTVQFNDDQVADFAEREVRINAAQGAVGFVWFQFNDGRDPNEYEDRFGIRDIDGNWKEVANRLGALGPYVA